MTATSNTFPLTMTLAKNCHPDELAKWCGMSDAWAAGLVDAVDGNPGIWSDAAPTQQERTAYAAGFRRGQALLMASNDAAVAA